MKRPKTFCFSERWPLGGAENAVSGEARGHLRRRRGRPPAAAARARWAQALRRVYTWWSQGLGAAEITELLQDVYECDIPREVVETYLANELGAVPNPANPTEGTPSRTAAL